MWKLDGLKPSKPLFMDGVLQNVIEKVLSILGAAIVLDNVQMLL